MRELQFAGIVMWVRNEASFIEQPQFYLISWRSSLLIGRRMIEHQMRLAPCMRVT